MTPTTTLSIFLMAAAAMSFLTDSSQKLIGKMAAYKLLPKKFMEWIAQAHRSCL